MTGLRAIVAALAVTLALGACGSEPPAEVTADEYLATLDALCAQTNATLADIPAPPEQISVAEFARSAAGALDNEASRMRRLDVPDEFEADHRALIRNTEEQAAAWSAISNRTDADEDDLVDTTTLIAQLLLGRDDLLTEMGATGCRRAAG